MTRRTGPPTPAGLDGAGTVLELIRRGRAGTVAALAESMGVARSTVLQRLEHLAALRLVDSAPGPGGARGRPAAQLSLRAGAGVVLAAHLGLTGTRAAVLDLTGTVVADRYLDLDPTHGATAVAAALGRQFDELLVAAAERRAGPLVGLGIGIPSTFELAAWARGAGEDTVERGDSPASGGPGLGAQPGPAVRSDRELVAEELARRYRVPVRLELDVAMLGIAEHRTSWPQAEVLVCVKVGSLIGASVVVRGLPVAGAGGLAGELGHLRVADADDPCACGATGCLDAVASGRAVVAQLRASGRPVTHVAEVLAMAAAGDPEAVRLLRRAGRRIGTVLASVVNLLNPAAVPLWGYLSESDAVLAGIRESVHRTALPGATERLTIGVTTLGPLAGVRGAALAVLDDVLAPRAVEDAVRRGGWSVPPSDAVPSPR